MKSSIGNNVTQLILYTPQGVIPVSVKSTDSKPFNQSVLMKETLLYTWILFINY